MHFVLGGGQEPLGPGMECCGLDILKGSCPDNGAESNVGPSHGVSGEERVTNINKWPGDHSCDILAKIVAAFCPCPKNPLEAKLKHLD